MQKNVVSICRNIYRLLTPTAQSVHNMCQITFQLFIGYINFCQTIASINESLFVNAQLLYRYFSYESRLFLVIFVNNLISLIIKI